MGWSILTRFSGAYEPARALLPPSGHPAQAGWTSVGALARRAQPLAAWPDAPFRAVSFSFGRMKVCARGLCFPALCVETILTVWSTLRSAPSGPRQAKLVRGLSPTFSSRCLLSCALSLQGDDRVSSYKRNSVQLVTRPRRGGFSGWRVDCRGRHGGMVLCAVPLAVLGRKVLICSGRWMLD